MNPVAYVRYRRSERAAYCGRLRERLQRVEADIAWANRQPAVLGALMLQEERRRRHEMADGLLIATLGLDVRAANRVSALEREARA